MNKARHPEIRITYGFLLEPLMKAVFEVSPKAEGETFPTPKEFYERFGHLAEKWKEVESTILDGICDVLELEFHQNTIDVHLAYTMNSMSYPMIIGVRRADDTRFIDLLTHELLHRLLTDNDQKLEVRRIWQEMFPDPDMSNLTRVHMLVHAVHEHVYRNVLHAPERLARNLAISAKFPDYAASWKIVQERGYMNVIAEFKQYYAMVKTSPI